jgi:hypothetical protein
MARNSRTRQKRAQQQRHRKKRSLPTNNECFKLLREWFLPNEDIFSKLKLHGNIKWMPTSLVWLALCWSWSESRNLTDAFAEALGCCQTMFGSTPLKTYQGFMGALVGYTTGLMPLLRGIPHQHMEQIGGKFRRSDGWVPMGFDGSRSTAPRTSSNEAAFCAANYGKGHTAKYRKKKSKGLRRKKNQKHKTQPQQPQAWITMIWHMALRLPWNWRLGPSNSSERAHVMEMVQKEKFPKNTLFCGDAGFVGYPLWNSLLEQGSDFLVRVGSNVSLWLEEAECTTEKLGKYKLVLCWPREVREAKQPPLRLRLLQVRLGKTDMWMLTSVLEWERLTDKAIVRFYKMRWLIEVEFRGLKQTLNHATLRSRNDKRLLVELDWSILAMAVAELFALKEQLSRKSNKGVAPDPVKRSLANTMRALRGCLRNLKESPEPGEDLASKLRAALTDDYNRKASKKARYRPKNPDKKKMGDPKLRPLTQQDKEKLDRLGYRMAA